MILEDLKEIPGCMRPVHLRRCKYARSISHCLSTGRDRDEYQFSWSNGWEVSRNQSVE